MSKSTLSAAQRTVDEKTTASYGAKILDETGAGIPAASLTTLTLTLYDFDSGTIINTRSDQNVLNANGVVVDSQGNLTWLMQPADNAIISADLPTNGTERHIALFKFTYAAGAKAGSHELELLVRNVGKVT